MRLLSASALWWLLLGAIILFFYLLKLKRKRRVVPSLFLWQRALEEIEANAPFKRLRRSLLMLLQLLALAAIVFALARPLVTLRSLASGSTIIVIDATASMSARDEDGRSRLDRAKQMARDMVNGIGANDRAAIIESSSRVAVLSPPVSDRAALSSAISDIKETAAAGDLRDAVRLAEQIARAEHDASIVIISDGGAQVDPFATGEPPATAAGGVPLRFVRVGRRADNTGIVAMNSRPVQGGDRQELFASIANFADRSRDVGVELRIDGRLVDARTVPVGANERSPIIFDSLPQAGGLAELKLVVADDLDADNVAYALLPDARRMRVGVFSENPFLLQAIAVNPDLEARRLAPSAAVSLSAFDCIVSDGPVPPGVLESNKPLLVINPSDVAGLWRVTGERERPEITSFERAHPVNSFLSYGDLHIENAARREVAAWLRPIASGPDDPLIWAGDDGHRRAVVVGFDLAKSDLPLKVEFPILLANSIAWLSGRDLLAGERAVRAGSPVTVRASSPSVEITTPGGETRAVETRAGVAVFGDTLEAGVYQAKDGPPFAVSLLSEAESDDAPRDFIKTRAGEVSSQAEMFKSEREAWRWLALVALAVLSFEWWVYHRRIFS
jgi:hypothetical protein